MRSKSSLFLIELIISTLFFALAGTVCVQMFVKAHLINEETTNTNQAILCAQNLAETYRETDADLSQMNTLFENSSIDGTHFYLYFDKDWNSTTKEQAVYEAELTSSDNETYHYGTIEVYLATDSSSSIYSLNTILHIQERSTANE